jgi:hypothetical protein
MSDSFLETFFIKIVPQDLENDAFLKKFYSDFLKNEASGISIYDYFKFYISHSKKHNEIFLSDELTLDKNKTDALLLDITKEIIDNAKSVNSEKVKIKKKYILPILSEYIRLSFQIISEEDLKNEGEDTPAKRYNENGETSTDQTEYDENFKNKITENIIGEIVEEYGKLPTAKKDENFRKINEMMAIWSDTEEKCKKLLEMDSKLQKKTFVINSANIKEVSFITSNEVKTTENDKDYTVIISPENINRRNKNTIYEGSIDLFKNSALSVAIEKFKVCKKTLYVCSGSKIIPGGGADQGFTCPESGDQL